MQAFGRRRATQRLAIGKLLATSAICYLLTYPTAASAQAASQTAAPDPQVNLGEIVITAQKRNERLQDAPVAASVVRRDALDRSDAVTISDLNKLVPSVQINGSLNGREPVAIRGISTNASEQTAGLTSGVAILIDGVPLPSDFYPGDKLEDAVQVEVLKGPQATLGGRTASAGVINIITQAPTPVWHEGFTGVATADGEYRARGYLSGPLSNVLSFSVSGYGDTVRYPVKNLIRDEHTRSDGFGVRGKLKLTLPQFDATLSGRISSFNSDGSQLTYQYLTPGAALFPYISGGVPQSTSFPRLTIGTGNTDYTSPVHMLSRTRNRDVALTMNYYFGDLTLSSITAYQRERTRDIQDVTLSATYFFNDLTGGFAPPFYNEYFITQPMHQFSQELKLTSPPNKPTNFVAGVFYSDTAITQVENLPFVANPYDWTVNSDTKALGIYGRLTVQLQPGTSLLVGARGNFDGIYASKEQGGLQGCGSEPSCTVSGEDKSTTIVGDVTLKQSIAGGNVYGTYARGYKPRVYNTAANFSAPDNLVMSPVDRENIDHFELGYKGALIARTLTLDAALFSTVYHGYQVQTYNASSIVPVLVLSNAGEARSRGIEADVNWRVSPLTSISLAAAYIDAKFLRFPGAACYPGQGAAEGCSGTPASQDLTGQTLPNSPKFKFNVSADHRFLLPHAPFDATVYATYSHQSRVNFQATGDPYTKQNAYGVLNLGAGLQTHDARVSATLFVNNVLNKFYVTDMNDSFSSLFGPTANAVIGAIPRDAKRYVGLRVSVSR